MAKYFNILKVTGKLSVNAAGCGFIDHSDDGTSLPDLFIPPQFLNGAISGDTVEAEVDPKCDLARPSGTIVKIIHRGMEHITGCLVRDEFDGTWGIRPLRRELPGYIKLKFNGKTQLSEGDWLQVKLVRPQSPEEQIHCELIKKISHSGTVTADLDAIVAEYDIPKRYTATDEAKAAKIVPAKVKREDATKLVTVTIDPVDARDYDDALSYEDGPKKGQCTIGVHIADVASYVKRGSSLDAAAAERCFTSYLPGRTIPMLPTTLANDLCSLKQGVDRLAHTVFITFDKKTARIVSYRRVHTTIHSDARLCYDEVQRFLDGEAVKFPPKVAPMLKNLADIAAKLRTYRADVERFLPMEMPEIRVICSEKPPRIAGIQINESSPSHELVEEFMLAANQCVADELLQRGIPGIFRNHQEPDPADMAEFAAIASQMLGRHVKPFSNRGDVARFMNKIQDNPARDAVEMVFLRHLQRATYDSENLGHYGLGKEKYTHFTSPIRRYADLLIHQQLLAMDQKRKPRTLEEITDLAHQCSEREIVCDQAEFAASDRMKIRWLDQEMRGKNATSIRGTVIKVSKKNFQVWLPDFGLIAFVGERQLPFANWQYNASANAWKHKKTGAFFALRTSSLFKIVTADPIRGDLILKPDPTTLHRK